LPALFACQTIKTRHIDGLLFPEASLITAGYTYTSCVWEGPCQHGPSHPHPNSIGVAHLFLVETCFFNKPARQFHGHVAALVLQFTTLVHGAARFGVWAEDVRVGKQLSPRYVKT